MKNTKSTGTIAPAKSMGQPTKAAANAVPKLPKKTNKNTPYAIRTYPMDGTEVTTIKPLKLKKKRVWELDFLRGLAILLVAMDHTFYDCWAVFGSIWADNATLSAFADFARAYSGGALREFWKPFFLFVFFFISGISSRFSKNNLFRSFKMVGAALFISIATYILDFYLHMDGTFVKFGVIHCFSIIVVFYALLELIIHVATLRAKHLKKWILSALCLILGIFVLIVDKKYNVGVMEFELHGEYAPVVWDSPLAGLFFYTRGFWSQGTADYFPLFPYLGYFMLGAGLTPFLYPNKKSLLPFLDGYQRLPFSGKRVYIGWWHKIFTVPGRFSLIIYIGWQVLAIAVLGVVTLMVFGYLPFF